MGCRRIVLSGSLLEDQLWAAPQSGPPSPYGFGLCGERVGRMFYALFDAPVVIFRPSLTCGRGDERTKVISHVRSGLLDGGSRHLSSRDAYSSARKPTLKTTWNTPLGWTGLPGFSSDLLASVRAAKRAGRNADRTPGRRNVSPDRIVHCARRGYAAAGQLQILREELRGMCLAIARPMHPRE